MKNYQAGECYNFWVTGLGTQRIYLKDDNDGKFSVYAFDFQTQWDWASPQVPIEVLNCYVREVRADGSLTLEQNKDFLIAALYPEALRNESKSCTMVVDNLKTINGTLYYVMNDAYGIFHMYKPSASMSILQPGDELELNVIGYKQKPKNRSYLIFDELPVSDHNTTVAPASDDMVDQDGTVDSGDTPVGEFGEEDNTREFKSTIVYPAGAVGADIDTQMQVILKTIAGFLNAQGGTLYIGVNDNGDAVGIEREYHLLNSSTKDKHKKYQQNRDGYENKLRSGMNAHLGPVAQDYVTITFSEHNGHTVCEVKIESSRSIIWYDERQAYKRMGNRTTYLRAEAISKLVLDKMALQRPANQQVVPTQVNNVDDILPVQSNTGDEPMAEPVVAKVTPPATIKKIGDQRQGRGSFYMNMFKNGDWSWSKEVPQDGDLEFCVPINNPTSKNDLLMVYADGCVNRVDAYHLHLAKKEDKRYMNGRRNDGVKLLKAFSATRDDMVACFSSQDGHPFVKVHPVEHISQHDNMSLNGNRMINIASKKGSEMEDICFVAAEHEQRVSALFKTENQTSNSLGFQMDLPKYEEKLGQVVKTLRKICDVQS